MDERNWRGKWWLPGGPDEPVAGTLYCAADGGLRLELIGGFDTEVRTPLPSGNGYTVSMESRDLPLIHGRSGGEAFTLIDCFAINTSGGMHPRNIVKQDLVANRALRGVLLDSLDEPVFVRAYLQVERLLKWADRSTFDLQRLMNEERTQVLERKASTHAVEPVSAEHGDMTVSLMVRGTEFYIKDRVVANRRSMETVEWATLRFEIPEPASYSAYDEVAKDLQDLLTLCAYEACGAHSRTLVCELPSSSGDGMDSEEIEVLGRQIFSTPQEADTQHHNFLFTLRDVEFTDLVPRWLSLKDEARLGFNILFGLRYIRSGYVGTRLLGVATAAESIHRALCETSTPLPKAVFRELKKKLNQAVADEPEIVQNFVRNLQNNPAYKDRMLELASIPDDEAVDRLLSDRLAWASQLRDARHDLAHANETADDGRESGALWLLEVTYALLCLVAMARLGMSAELQRRAVEHPTMIWAARQFRKTCA
ncbi:MAG TPA: HEPN domain-containing protein [Mycobacteriales bacterium]|nr:HEPN domain-containing protein [Mycobacteriales bacterium]